MNTLRLIKSNYTYADFSTNLSPALERALDERVSGNTVSLNIFPQDSFTVGFLDDPEKSLDLKYCEQQKIVVRRRKNAGGAIFGAKGAAFICFYLDRRIPWVPVKTVKDLFPFFLKILADVLNEQYGLATAYRPLNDIEVGGRKIVATSARLENDIMTLRCLLNVKPTNREVLSKAVIAHAEKFKDKKTKTVGERFTCLEEETARTIADSELEDITLKVVARAFGPNVTLLNDEMTELEKKYAEEMHRECTSEDWFYANSEKVRFKEIPPDVKKVEGLHKAPAGLIRFILLVKGDRIHDLIITGDFHPAPYSVLKDMENALRKKPIDIEEIKKEITKVYSLPDVEIAGTDVQDFITACEKAISNL